MFFLRRNFRNLLHVADFLFLLAVLGSFWLLTQDCGRVNFRYVQSDQAE